MNVTSRKEFLQNAVLASGALLTGCVAVPKAVDERHGDFLDVGQRETDQVKPADYLAYLRDGDARGLASLEKLERGFARMMDEIRSTRVTDTPAVWLVYNMGVVVKTRESLFSIDLVHRRALELAPLLDFALITHNHSDHYQQEFYRAMNGSGKMVINNFIDNYGFPGWKGGYTRGAKVFKLGDVEVRTSLTDHNHYLVDYTTAFEIKVGDWKMYHTGDCSNVAKLNPIWGKPNLWVVFPGCGIDIAAGVGKLRPGRVAFGHLWELAHEVGRLTTPMVRDAVKSVRAVDANVPIVIPMWGERIV